jgi:hypothetical protein
MLRRQRPPACTYLEAACVRMIAGNYGRAGSGAECGGESAGTGSLCTQQTLQELGHRSVSLFERSKDSDRASSLDHRWSPARSLFPSKPAPQRIPQRIGSTKDEVGATRAYGKSVAQSPCGVYRVD